MSFRTEDPPSEEQSPVRPGLPRSIWTTILPARLLINAQFRIAYPFLPAMSRGLGVPLATASLLLTVRDLMGVTSPLFGFMSDRVGRRVIMVTGLAVLIAGAAALATGRSYGLALIGFGLLGLSKPSYDPAMQAYVSDEVPYGGRGRAPASEFSIVTTLPLVLELSTSARGAVLAINAALMSLAAAMASLLAPRLWDTGSLGLVTAVSAAGVLLATVLLWRTPKDLGVPRTPRIGS